jgi:hypothetical protein
VWAFDEGANWLRPVDYLNYQMFTKNMNTSQEVIRQYFE